MQPNDPVVHLPEWRYLQYGCFHCGSARFSARFIFPQHIHGLLVGLDFPPGGRLSEPGLSRDYKDVLGTLLGMDLSGPELACHCLWLSPAAFSSPVFADD